MQLVHQLRTSSSNCREDALLGASSSIQQLWTATLKSFPWKLRNTAIVQLQPCMQRAIPNLERGSEKVVLYRGRRSGSPQRNYMPFGNEESCNRKWRRGNGSRFAKDEQASFCGRSSSEIEVIKRKKKGSGGRKAKETQVSQGPHRSHNGQCSKRCFTCHKPLSADVSAVVKLFRRSLPLRCQLYYPWKALRGIKGNVGSLISSGFLSSCIFSVLFSLDLLRFWSVPHQVPDKCTAMF